MSDDAGDGDTGDDRANAQQGAGMGAAISNRRPIIVTGAETATCERHGEMDEMEPIIRRHPTGNIHVAMEPYSMWTCPECCIEVRREVPIDPPAGAPLGGTDSEEAVMWVMFLLVQGSWDSFAPAFVDLGPGVMAVTDNEGNVVDGGGDGDGEVVGFETSTGARLTIDDDGRDARWRGVDDADEDEGEDEDADDGGFSPSRVLRLEDPPAVETIPDWLLVDDPELAVVGPDGRILAQRDADA